MALKTRRMAQNPDFVVRGDDSLPVFARQWYERPGGRRALGLPEIWLYAPRLSFGAGEVIPVHAISTGGALQLELWTGERTPRLLHRQEGITAPWQETPEDASAAGCGWPQAAAVPVAEDWPSGICRLVLKDSQGSEAEHVVVIRPRAPDPARLLLITADGTWNAYNDWGGSNHYEGIIDQGSPRFSPRLSLERPFARGMISLPEEAPRTLPLDGDAALYPHMDWAWEQGFSKKYASAGWAMYERPFLHWAEAEGYGVDVLTQRDLHQRPELMQGYACAVCVGHDEYWSWQMRDAIDSFVEGGGNVARFAGNFMWQIRLEDGGQTQICHKYLARQEDPVYGTGQEQYATHSWEAPEVGRPGRSTFGLDASRGLYAGFGGLARQGAGGFTLYREDHWAFEGCRLGYGDILGAQSRIFGYEVDGLGYRIEDGLPFPENCEGLPAGLEILALGLARLLEDPWMAEQGLQFVGDADAEFAADTLYGRRDEAALAKVNRGSGMIVHFARGRGEVFHAGTTEWVAGLLRGDTAVEQVTRNVLNRFLLR
jgi:hypothetical protein